MSINRALLSDVENCCNVRRDVKYGMGRMIKEEEMKADEKKQRKLMKFEF